MNTKIRRGSWIVTAPVAAAAVAYIMLVFLPGRRAIGEAHDQIEQKRDYITRAISVAAALQIGQQELEKAEAYNTAWEERAPVQEELSALYAKIHELAGAAGTTITRFDPEPVVRYDKICQIPFTMGCTGSFLQIYRFLQGLEGLPVEIWINDAVLEKIVGTQSSISSELTLVVFASNPENSDYVKHSE